MSAPPLTLPEAAAALNVSVRVLLAHVRAGALRALDLTPVRPGSSRSPRGRRAYRIERHELQRFVDAIRTTGAPPPPRPPETPPKALPARRVKGATTPRRMLGEWER